ncbi:putative ribonuclease H-like domain-containing protein [Tanacetum coccineum]
MLADSLLPIPFWAEAVNTSCYVLNRVLVTKPQNKTPYELLIGKFDGKSDEGYLLGYSTSRTGPNWMFDLDFLTNSMNYIPVSVENQLSFTDACSYHILKSCLWQDIDFKDNLFIFLIVRNNGQFEYWKAELEVVLIMCGDMLEIWYETLSFFPARSNGFRRVKQQPDGIFISQDKYVADILKKFDFCSIKTATTPIESNKPLVKDEDGVEVDVHEYRSMIGSLMYLTASRPDIMFAVCACARFQVTPKASHLHAVKRIFRYLKHQPKLGLWYPRDSPFELEAFSDSDYAGASLDRKSTTGGCQFLGRRLISWQCKKQTIVANSTTEAEYVAAAHCCGQVLWIQNQMMDYGFNFMNTKIHIDNESTICVVKNPVYHSRTKHIEIRHHFIRDCYEKRLIDVLKIHTDSNVADLLTKGFDVTRISMDLRMDRCSAGKFYSSMVFHMANLKYSDKHNMVAFLKKPNESVGFTEVVDFIKGTSLRYALTHNPTIYDSLVKQFWQTATVRTLANGTLQLVASIDSKEYIITEASVRSKLQLADATGIHNLSDAEIYAGLATLGYVTEGDIVPLLPAMLAGAAVDQGEGSAQPAEPHHTPVDPIPSTSHSPHPSPQHQSPPHSPLHHSPYQSPPHSPHHSPPQSSPHFSPPRTVLEKELKDTKQTLGNAVLKLVKKVKTLETALKRKSKKVLISESEGEESEDQGRKFQDID